MQATGIQHEEIRDPVAGVAQDIFGAATAFDATQRMFNAHAHPGEGRVALFLSGR
jgi:hypothetical protein